MRTAGALSAATVRRVVPAQVAAARRPRPVVQGASHLLLAKGHAEELGQHGWVRRGVVPAGLSRGRAIGRAAAQRAECSGPGRTREQVVVPHLDVGREILLRVVQVEGLRQLQPWCAVFPGASEDEPQAIVGEGLFTCQADGLPPDRTDLFAKPCAQLRPDAEDDEERPGRPELLVQPQELHGALLLRRVELLPVEAREHPALT